ncbi:MAG: ABC transporter substrate-binding protein [Desulfuromonadales bacterium]
MKRELLFGMAVVALLVCGCTEKKPIKIGYMGSITGKHSDLGVAARDAAMLAVEQLNGQGGINGRKLELIVRDDTFDAKVAEQMAGELVKEGVAAIVGPVASSMSKAALPVVEKAGVVMVSPTSSSNELSGKDDYFFRVMEPNSKFAGHLAESALKLGIRRLAVIYDTNNRPYTVDIFHVFREVFIKGGGTVTSEVSFDSNLKPSFLPLVKQLGTGEADGVMVLASSVDSIVIAQQIRKEGTQAPILSGACGIAQRDLLQLAGKSSEGMIFTLPVNSQSVAPAYTSFKESFSKRFNYPPTFAAVLAYDATQLILTSLKKDSDTGKLRQTVKSISSFDGLQGPIRLDEFGDPNRKLFVLRYRDGREEVLNTPAP